MQLDIVENSYLDLVQLLLQQKMPALIKIVLKIKDGGLATTKSTTTGEKSSITFNLDRWS